LLERKQLSAKEEFELKWSAMSFYAGKLILSNENFQTLTDIMQVARIQYVSCVLIGTQALISFPTRPYLQFIPSFSQWHFTQKLQRRLRKKLTA
jgi:hypothetical protein